MQNMTKIKRGGRRVGAGRPKGTYKYCAPTVPVRVPAKLVGEVEAFKRMGCGHPARTQAARDHGNLHRVPSRLPEGCGQSPGQARARHLHATAH
jgi:hypothetical protein